MSDDLPQKDESETGESWPEGVSDGLTLSCGLCKRIPKFDYLVDDLIWNRVVPDRHRLGVVCLSCLDCLAYHQDVDISEHLQKVQFTGIGKTIILRPEWTHRYKITRPVPF